jgi:hypothetical protein
MLSAMSLEVAADWALDADRSRSRSSTMIVDDDGDDA